MDEGPVDNLLLIPDNQDKTVTLRMTQIPSGPGLLCSA